MDHNLSKRLHSKSVKNAIVNNISHDFNLTPILAEAYFYQIKTYFLEHADIELSAGQMQYLAVDDREPAGKPVTLCNYYWVVYSTRQFVKSHMNKFSLPTRS
jgi:hypothetical protein